MIKAFLNKILNWFARKPVVIERVVTRQFYYVAPKVLTEAEEKRQNLERLLVLADIGDANQLWKTVLSYADEHAGNEQVGALAANVSPDLRAYNAGRAASALDFAQALRDLRTKAIAEAKKAAE